ncbi:hypothetical protein GBP07_09250 [Pediococcus acidilactici]|nr:hypothetical protein CYD95_05315 [Pediococcus acidilactici]KAF0365312.1 hypothetical protein GBO50_01225 [Pediococcus acidilactici]KAF0368752.1 hypothetical protein GBO52_00720 [Pediococcus acidilactici]KAF0369390.1 hypothetical protein GBO55_01225 [Pediococcus acidilactici]KAF0370421.1 hypothetical protein GBO60_08250 [Pediococcus acidilactici]
MVKRNQLTFGTRFGFIEGKILKQLSNDLFILEKYFFSLFPTSSDYKMFYKSFPLDLITFLYQSNESFFNRCNVPRPESSRST